MAPYGRTFAEVYDKYWSSFSLHFAPRLFELFEAERKQFSLEASLLDLGCGTGRLARYFLERGYRVTGVDRSADMIDRARLSARGAARPAMVDFVTGDLSDLPPLRPHAFAVSLYDTLNHLSDLEALGRCLRSAYDSLLPGGRLVFDLNTRVGLRRWNGVHFVEEADAVFMNRGIYDPGMNRAATRITGFIRKRGTSYERFEEVITNTVFEIAEVTDLLAGTGFEEVMSASPDDWKRPAAEPEALGRVFLLARRPGNVDDGPAPG